MDGNSIQEPRVADLTNEQSPSQPQEKSGENTIAPPGDADDSRAVAVEESEKALLAASADTVDSKAPTEEPPQTAQGVAETILRWAKEHRLFAKPSMEEAADAVEYEAPTEITAAQMFSSAQVEAILRRRAINLIVFNEPSKKVVVFTKSRVTSSDTKIIPYAAKNVAIEYAVGGSPTVKGVIPAPHEPRPYHFYKGRYCCGSSVFTGNCMGAGTLGFLAKDRDGHLYGVTNNHVTGACNHSPPGMPILAPGPIDIVEDSIEPFCIGRHHKLVPINDGIPENMDISGNLDASTFRIVDGAPVCSMQGTLCDTPSKVADPTPGKIVEKIGRTTGHTKGRIVGQSVAPLAVSYVVPEYNIRKQVYFKTVFIVEGLSGDFSVRGDSGSLVMTAGSADEERAAVGVVFAGDEQRKLSYILPLNEILDRMELTICSGFNV